MDVKQPTRPTSEWCWSSEKCLAKERSSFSVTVFQRRKREGETKLTDLLHSRVKNVSHSIQGIKRTNYVLICFELKPHHFSKPLPTSIFLQFTKPTHFKTSKQERKNYENTWKLTSLNSIKEKTPTLAWNKNPAYPGTKATLLNRTTCPPSFYIYFPEKLFFLPVIGSDCLICGHEHFTYQRPQIKTNRTNTVS